jgi:hypothetical protein
MSARPGHGVDDRGGCLLPRHRRIRGLDRCLAGIAAVEVRQLAPAGIAIGDEADAPDGQRALILGMDRGRHVPILFAWPRVVNADSELADIASAG